MEYFKEAVSLCEITFFTLNLFDAVNKKCVEHVVRCVNIAVDSVYSKGRKCFI